MALQIGFSTLAVALAVASAEQSLMMNSQKHEPGVFPKVKFPVAYLQDTLLNTFGDERTMCTASPTVLRKLGSKRANDFILAADGKLYQVLSERFAKYATLLWGITIWGDRLVRTRIEVQEIDHLSLEEMKAFAVKAIRSLPNRAYNSIDEAVILKEIDNSKNEQQVISALRQIC